MKQVHKFIWIGSVAAVTLISGALYYQFEVVGGDGDWVGASAQYIILDDSQGRSFNLGTVIGKETVVLFFYHANW